MTGILWNFASFIIALGILVAVHEFGHFWVARRCGVKVEKFSIGFGKSIWSRIGKDGTEYSQSRPTFFSTGMASTIWIDSTHLVSNTTVGTTYTIKTRLSASQSTTVTNRYMVVMNVLK